MKELFEKLNLDSSLKGQELNTALETEKQKTLRRLNSAFGNYNQEIKLQALLKEIETAQAKLSQPDGQATPDAEAGLVASKALNISEADFTPRQSTQSPEDEKRHQEDDSYFDKGMPAYKDNDYKSALDFFLKAAEQGSISAMFNVGAL